MERDGGVDGEGGDGGAHALGPAPAAWGGAPSSSSFSYHFNDVVVVMKIYGGVTVAGLHRVEM
jgi:hypothetical protein